MDGGAGWAKMAADAVKAAAETQAVHLQIEEAKSDYAQEIQDTTAQMNEAQAEGARRLQQTKMEGVVSLDELSREAAYESGVAQTQAAMESSGAVAKLGASGARAAGSPILAMRQTQKLAQAAATEKTESGNASVSLGALKLTGNLADITAQTTLATNEYQRKIAEAKRKKSSLEQNQAQMEWLTGLGGVAGLASDVAPHIKW